MAEEKSIEQKLTGELSEQQLEQVQGGAIDSFIYFSDDTKEPEKKPPTTQGK